MANNIVFKVLAETKDFQTKFKKLNQTASKVTRNATIAFAAFGGAIAVVTKLAKDQQKVMNQTRAVLRSTGNVAGITAEEVFKLGKEMQDLTTFGDEVVISATNMLLTFKEISAEVLPRATKAVLDMSIAMNQGLKESSIQLGKALNDPILGLTAMRRVGIQFTKSQEDQIKALTKAGDIMKAQGLILEELESQFGGSAEAARKGLGSIDALKNSLGDLGENIALVIAPAVERLANSLTKLADKAKESKVFVAITATFLILGVVISGLLIVIGAVVTAITAIGPAIAGAIAAVVAVTGLAVAGFVSLKEEVKETDEAINGDDGIFSKGEESSEQFTGFLETMREKMVELKDESFLLGAAITAGLQGGIGGDIGRVTVTGPAGGGKAEPPAFLQGFSSGLDEIKEKVSDITALGKEMALTFHKGMSSAISDTILRVKTAKEAFVDFGKAMLKAIVNFVAEWISFQILSKAGALIAQTLSLTLAASLAAAWAPVAAFVSLATFGANSGPASAGIASTVALSKFLAVPGFQSGSSGIKDDTVGMFNKNEIVVPSSFADGIRSGDLALSGGEGAGGGVVVDLRGATINGITDEVVEEMFTKASENIANGTLAFRGVS